MTKNEEGSAHQSPFLLRGRAFPFPTLEILDADAPGIEEWLKNKVAAAPGFWSHAAVMLDLTALAPEQAPALIRLCARLRAVGLFPAGYRASDETVAEAARLAGLGRVMEPEGRDQDHVAGEEPVRRPTMLIEENIRSGRIIYATGSDLIVYGNVNQGAELHSDGNIVVQGALRGRACAGAADDGSARIMASVFDPELVSIAGLYLTAGEIPSDRIGQRVQVWMQDGYLQFGPLP